VSVAYFNLRLCQFEIKYTEIIIIKLSSLKRESKLSTICII